MACERLLRPVPPRLRGHPPRGTRAGVLSGRFDT
jgi:hypothetical protein